MTAEFLRLSSNANSPPSETRSEPSPDVAVYRVNPSTLDLIWPQVEPILRRAVARERGSFGTPHIYDWVRTGAHHLWIVSEDHRILAAFLSQVVTHASGRRTLVVHAGAGTDARRWMDRAVETLEQFGHLQGATEMRVVGRKGWLRYLAPHGYQLRAVILSKDKVFG